MRIEDILANVSEFVGKYVTVEGTLTRVSRNDAWFVVSSGSQADPSLRVYLATDDDQKIRSYRPQYRQKVLSLNGIWFHLNPPDKRDLVRKMYNRLWSKDDNEAEQALNFFSAPAYGASLIRTYSTGVTSMVVLLDSISRRHFGTRWPFRWDDADVRGLIEYDTNHQLYLTNLTVIHARKGAFGIYINIENSDTKYVFPLNRTCLTVQDVFRNFEELLGQEVALEGYIAGKEMYGLEPFLSDGFRSLIVPSMLHTLGKLRMNYAIFLDMPEFDEHILNYVDVFYGDSTAYGGKVQLVGTVVESRMPYVFIGIDNVKFLATNPEGYIIYWKNDDI